MRTDAHTHIHSCCLWSSEIGSLCVFYACWKETTDGLANQRGASFFCWKYWIRNDLTRLNANTWKHFKSQNKPEQTSSQTWPCLHSQRATTAQTGCLEWRKHKQAPNHVFEGSRMIVIISRPKEDTRITWLQTTAWLEIASHRLSTWAGSTPQKELTGGRETGRVWVRRRRRRRRAIISWACHSSD